MDDQADEPDDLPAPPTRRAAEQRIADELASRARFGRRVAALDDLQAGIADQPNCIVETDDPSIAVVFIDGEPVRAVARRCPHQRALLDRKGHVNADGIVTCKHKDYAWNCLTGAVLVAATDVAELKTGTVVLIDGQIHTDIELPENEATA